MMRCYVVIVLVLGFSSLTACGGASSGASNGAFAPSVPATSVRPLSDVVYNFGLPPDAEFPAAGLLAGKKGEYYGTSYGGRLGDGTVYEITTAGQEKVLHNFQGTPDGAYPTSTLIMDNAGALYGTTGEGGSGGGSSCAYDNGCGTVFKLTPGKRGWTESVLYDFQGGSQNDGVAPNGGLLMTKSGALFGTTGGGGGINGRGTVYKLTPSGSTYRETILHTFTGPPDGIAPDDALVSDSSGNLYGTTVFGGLVARVHCPRRLHGCGTVFKLKPSGSTYTYSVIYRFKGGSSADGVFPESGVLPGRHGVLYGLTTEGGAHSEGTAFELVPMGPHYREKLLHSFGGGGGDGAVPQDTPGLVADRSGNLYGTTAAGGASGGYGTVFKLSPSGSGFTESVVYTFQGYPSDGEHPYSGLIIDSKGNLLGPTFNGGSSGCGNQRGVRALSTVGCGTIFSIAP
ncbi:MAG TPA: choice-of-anchor tandem repeat GloVer-containing protein [Candidatus Cybelea sp.]|jgi:uncharacterized repeat protein (TIGR03803 family)